MKNRYVREYLRPDPSGYYVVVAKKELLQYIPPDILFKVKVETVDAETIIVRTKSRSVAKKLVEVGLGRKLLAS
ncbi:MAG: hypothetical protein DRO12_03685 [Thermoprotei archaeon]|nr:MAG: hypothetical protein DRO12_03685 [Thermoprotei archaeon]